MFWRKLKKLFLILVNLEFSIPQKNKIFLVSSDKFAFLEKLLKNKFQILNRNKFNFYILILLLIKKKNFSKNFHLNYLEIYLSCMNARVLISTIDNNPIYWLIKNRIPRLKVLIIQNGWRYKEGDIFEHKNLIYNKDFKVDYFFTFNHSISKIYSKYIKAKFIEIGSYRNNQNLIRKKTKNNKVLFISEFINLKKKFEKKENMNLENLYFKPETILLPHLKKICIKYGLNLEVLPKTFLQNEYLFFKKYLGEKNWSFKKKIANPYKYIDEANIVVFMISTLGYEAIARNKKVLSFCCKGIPQFSKKKILRTFAWPVYSRNKKGFFWTNELSLKIFSKKFDSLIKINKNKWNKKISKYKDDIIIYDKNNSMLKKKISEICKNI